MLGIHLKAPPLITAVLVGMLLTTTAFARPAPTYSYDVGQAAAANVTTNNHSTVTAPTDMGAAVAQFILMASPPTSNVAPDMGQYAELTVFKKIVDPQEGATQRSDSDVKLDGSLTTQLTETTITRPATTLSWPTATPPRC